MEAERILRISVLSPGLMERFFQLVLREFGDEIGENFLPEALWERWRLPVFPESSRDELFYCFRSDYNGSIPGAVSLLGGRVCLYMAWALGERKPFHFGETKRFDELNMVFLGEEVEHETEGLRAIAEEFSWSGEIGPSIYRFFGFRGHTAGYNPALLVVQDWHLYPIWSERDLVGMTGRFNSGIGPEDPLLQRLVQAMEQEFNQEELEKVIVSGRTPHSLFARVSLWS